MRLELSSDTPARSAIAAGARIASLRRLLPTPRTVLLGSLFTLAGVFLTFMATQVPVRNLVEPPALGQGPIVRYWPAALVGLLIVIAVDAVIVTLGARARGRAPSLPYGSETGVPAALRLQRVPGPAVVATAIASGTILLGTVALGLPMWQRTLWALLPWTPVFAMEEVWRYRRYGFYAVFVGVAVLQVGHLGEHGAQVFQLYLSGGDLTVSHGVFGQLDFETVHFVWDTAVWIGGGFLVYRFWDNKWLWLSWLVASVHQVEHMYLFWVNQLHTDFWARGGIHGIFGQDGLVGSPLARPYLHLGYNIMVVVPMLVGLWDEARRVSDREEGSGPASPERGPG